MGDTTAVADGDVEITELVKIEPTRVDGVGTPANGFPVLMMKALGEDAAPAAGDAEPAAEAPAEDAEQAASADPAAPGAEPPQDEGEDEGEAGDPPLTPLQVAQQRAADAAKNTGTPPQPDPVPHRRAAAPGVARTLLDPEQYQRALAYADQALSGELTAKALFAKADAAAAPDGDGNDETSDLDGAAQVLVLLARLIASEAEELARGDFREATDICILLDMVNSLQCFIGREEQQAAGSFAPVEAGSTVTIAMSARDDGLLKAKYNAGQLRQMLADGKAFKNPDGEPSYPIGDTEDLDNAIRAVGRGKGDHDAVRAYIIRRAKALGASAKIPENWNSDGSLTAAKSAAPQTSGDGATAPTPETLTEIVTKAVAEATKTSQGRIEALEAELAKVKATPIPGGPVLIAPPKAGDAGQRASKAAHYRALAARVTDTDARRGYLALADEEDAKGAA